MKNSLSVMLFLLSWGFASAAESPFPVEELPTDPKAHKVVLIAGSNYFKPGEHDYIAAVRVYADLLKQTPNVAPVIAIDWPTKKETLPGAKAIVFLFDGAEKHALLKGERFAEITKLADAGVGLVFLHQTVDFPKDFLERAKNLTGAVWEKGKSQRGHWITTFETAPKHEIGNGYQSFKIDDGWLYQLAITADRNRLTPLLKSLPPKAKNADNPGDDGIVAWAFERSKGRTFCFTGTHLHASFAQDGYRQMLINGMLWSAGHEIPKGGASVKLDPTTLDRYLTPAPKPLKK